MGNTTIIHELQKVVSARHWNVYTASLIDIARCAITERTSPPEQQMQLFILVKLAEQLSLPSEQSFLGSTAKLL